MTVGESLFVIIKHTITGSHKDYYEDNESPGIIIFISSVTTEQHTPPAAWPRPHHEPAVVFSVKLFKLGKNILQLENNECLAN